MFFLKRPRAILFSVFMLGLGLFAMSIIPEAKAQENTTTYPYTDTFIISAYYSPLPGQARYVTGSYEGDIRLNGRGTNGADGTPVYPGMVAAPKKYPFGTKLNIPGVGIVTVHDRGGAITVASADGHSHDRLDIWMGRGDEGLRQALKWGMRTVENTIVYGVDPSMQDSVYFPVTTAAEAFVKTVVAPVKTFKEDIWYQSNGEEVKRLQEVLQKLGYFPGKISGHYGEETWEAVYAFQKENHLVENRNDWGAGHAGMNTRRALDLALARMKEDQDDVNQEKNEKALTALSKHPDLLQKRFPFHRTLQVGVKGEDVKALQEELNRLGLLRIDPKHYGFYGKITENAVLKLQQRWKLVGNKGNTGAGIFGPKTRDALNQVLSKRVEVMSDIAIQREEQNPMGQDVILVQTFSKNLAVGDRGDEVQTLQKLLKELGFFKGAFVTQFYGEQTKSAVQEFQIANGLIDSIQAAQAGKMDETTRAALNHLS